jgi:anti-sigma factor RsiW
MSCTFEEDLTAYVDGELLPARRAEVETHLPGCLACRSTEALLRRTVARLAELPGPVLSTATRRQVLARIDELPVPLRQRLLALLRPSVLVPAAGLAAVAGLAVYLGQQSVAPELEDPQMLELAANLEVLEDYDIAGLEAAEDLEVVASLHELEVQP